MSGLTVLARRQAQGSQGGGAHHTSLPILQHPGVGDGQLEPSLPDEEGGGEQPQLE